MPQAQNRVRMSLNDYAEEAAVVNEQSAKLANANRFIEANTQEVTLYHLSNDCITPVFSRITS